MKAKFFIRFLAGTVFLILFNFQMVYSDDHTGRIPDDVRPDVICVVFGHQSRWDIDADNLCRGGVDVFDQRGKAAG